MKIPSPSPRDRRALVLGAMFVVPVTGWFWIARPYLRAVERSADRLAVERELLVREEALLARAAEYPLAWEEGSQRLLAVAPRLFIGDNPAVASAALAHYLQTGAQASRVLLTQIEPGTPEEAGDHLVVVPLHVEGESDLEGLLSLLYGLESGIKLVRVENLTVRRGGPGRAVGPDEPQVLTFTFEAAGFTLLGGDVPEGYAGGAEVVP